MHMKKNDGGVGVSVASARGSIHDSRSSLKRFYKSIYLKKKMNIKFNTIIQS